MSRVKWNVIKQGKFFYIKTYRRASLELLVSLMLNVLFAMAAFYVYYNQPAREFYATTGITEPTKLTPMLSPNYGSEALLPPDQEYDENNEKVIPN